jgi:prepilin-type N-terminal cleavage/methylation domain-containing protein
MKRSKFKTILGNNFPNQTPGAGGGMRQYMLGFLARKDQGFTMVEIVLVSIVVGVLTALSLPTFFHCLGKVEKVKVLLTLDTLAKTIQLHHFEQGRYPADLIPGQSLPFISNWPTDADKYDYEHWGTGNGSCSVLITYYGQDGVRQSPIHHHYGPAGNISDQYGDDILKVIDVYECPSPVGGII